MSKLTNILLGLSLLGLSASYSQGINAQTITQTKATNAEDTIVCIPAMPHDNYFFFNNNTRDTIFIKGDSVLIKSNPIYIKDTIYQEKYNQEIAKNRDLQNKLDSLFAIKQYTKTNKGDASTKTQNTQTRYNTDTIKEKSSFLSNININLKRDKDKKESIIKKREEKRKEKYYAKTNKEDRKIDKIGRVAGQIGKYALLSPVIAPATIGYGIYIGLKKATNPFRDCPCDKETGEKIPKKINSLWLKNLQKQSKQARKFESKTTILSIGGPKKGFIKCPTKTF